MLKNKISVFLILGLLIIPIWLFNQDTKTSSSPIEKIEKYMHILSEPTIYTPQALQNNVNFWKDIYANKSIFSIVYYTPIENKQLKVLEAKLDFGLNQDSLIEISLQDDGKEIARYAVDHLDPLNSVNILLLNDVKEKIDEIYDELDNKLHEKNIIPEDKHIGYTRGRKEKYLNSWKFSGKYIDQIKDVFKSLDVPEEIAYLAFTESSFDIYAKSNSNAVGLFQMIPETARKFGLLVHNNIDQRKDPLLEAHAAALYLKDLYEEFGDWLWAINAYHSGEANLRKAKKWADKYYSEKPNDFDGSLEEYQYSKVVFEFPDDREFNTDTLKYGPQSARYTTLFLAFLESKNIFDKNTSRDNPADYETIKVNYSKNYTEKKEIAIESGDNLFDLANYYGVSVENIKEWNNMNDSTLYAGEQITVFTENPPITFKNIFEDLELDLEEQEKIFEYNFSYRERDDSIEIFQNKKIYNLSTVNIPTYLKGDILNYIESF